MIHETKDKTGHNIRKGQTTPVQSGLPTRAKMMPDMEHITMKCGLSHKNKLDCMHDDHKVRNASSDTANYECFLFIIVGM